MRRLHLQLKYYSAGGKKKASIYREALIEAERKDKVVADIKRAFKELAPDLDPEDQQFVDQLFDEYRAKGGE